MNSSLLIAAVLAFLLGIAHSVIGEFLIFRYLRDIGLAQEYSSPVLKKRSIRALWASWHLVTIFGWGFAAILLHLSRPAADTATITNILTGTLLASAIFWLFSTHGKHPAWIVLLLIAGIIWMA